MVVRLFLVLCLVFLRVTAEPPVPHGLVGQVFIYEQVNQSAFINVSWKVEGEGSDLHFNVFHKHVSELGFHKMGVGNNRTVTLKNVVIGEEYEVRVSSVELSTGKVSPLSRAVTVGVNYVQKVVTVPVTGGVSITCKFAHTSHHVGCIVILTSGSFRKGDIAIASNEGVTIPQATVEFTNLRPHEYTYSATAYLVANGQLLQQNRSISGTVTPLDQTSNIPEDTFIYQNFDLLTVIFIVVGVVLLPVILLLLVAILNECGKRCARKQRNYGLYITAVDGLAYAAEVPKSRQKVAAVNGGTQQHDMSPRFDKLADNGSYKEESDSFCELPPVSRASTIERYSTHANHGSALERSYSHTSSTSSFGKALSLSDVEPRRNSVDRKRRLSFKGSFPFIAVRRESVDREALSKAYSCDTGLNAGNDSTRPLGKGQSLSHASEDTISLRTSLFNILDAFESQIISVPGSPGTKESLDKEVENSS